MSGLVLFVVLMVGGLVGSQAVAPKPSTCAVKHHVVLVETRTALQGEKVWHRGFCTQVEAVAYGRSLPLMGWTRDTKWTVLRQDLGLIGDDLP